MKKRMFWVLALVMMFAAAPAFSGEAVQMWACEMDDEAAHPTSIERVQKIRLQHWCEISRIGLTNGIGAWMLFSAT